MINSSPISLEQELALPSAETYQPPALGLGYGADLAVSEYCGYTSYPKHFPFRWQHGWVPQQRQVAPISVITESADTTDHILVARNDERTYLAENGYHDVRAVGLPIVYTKPPQVERRSDSLLVMPAHSLAYTQHQWRFDEYVDAINSIRDQFTDVVICVHPDCISKGYWSSQFTKAGYTIVPGASWNDRNGHRRIAALLSTFDYVTTNSCGSHVAYAAHFGAKISVFGPYAESRAEDYANTPFYRENPELLEPIIAATSESRFCEHIPFLFVQPRRAEHNLEWGHKQIGADNKLRPDEMRSLLDWNSKAIMKRRLKTETRRLLSLGHKIIAPSLTNRIRSVFDQDLRKRSEEVRQHEAEENRLRSLDRYTPTTTSLLGHSLDIVDALSYIHAKKAIIDRACYRFVAKNSCPVILDCGANIGLSVIYFKTLYPNSKIIAFEPDPVVYDTLSRNCKSFEIEDNLNLLQKAVWTENGVMGFEQEGADAGYLKTDHVRNDTLEVQTVRLRDYLDGNYIDMLKIDIEGAETAVLEDCADLLHNVENLFVEYHSFAGQPQTLHIIMNILAEAGFRIHIHPESISPQPFFLRNIDHNMDHQINIYAFR